MSARVIWFLAILPLGFSLQPLAEMIKIMNRANGHNEQCHNVFLGFQDEPETFQDLANGITVINDVLKSDQIERFSMFFHDQFDCLSFWADLRGINDTISEHVIHTLIDALMRKTPTRDKIFLVRNLDIFRDSKFHHPTYILEETQQGMYTLHLGCPNQNELTLLNTWDINKDYQALNQSIQAKKKCPHIFQGAHLTISCRGLPPFNIWKPDGSVYGVDVDLIQILSQAFGFSYDIVTESVMGSLIPNSKNQWLGVVGSVKNGTSTIGIGNPALDLGRYMAVDYSVMMYTIETNFISTFPKPTPPYENLLKPFSLYLWVCLIMTLAVLTIVLVAIGKWHEDQPVEKILPLPFMSLIEQNIRDFRFKSKPSKFLIGLWYLTVFFILSGYSCNLRAFLVATEYEKPIDTAEDILTSRKEFFLPLGTSLEFSIVNSPKKVYQELHTISKGFFLENGWLSPPVEKSLLASKGVIIFPKEPVQMQYDTFQKAFGYQPFRISKSQAFEYHAGFLFPKFATWKDDVNVILGQLRDMGFIEKLKREYYPLGSLIESDENRDNNQIRPFGFQHFYAGFICLGAGLILASIAFVGEMIRLRA